MISTRRRATGWTDGTVSPEVRHTRLYVGYVPGFPGAHSQGETIEELNENLKEVIPMLLDDGEPTLEGEYVGTQTVVVT